MKRADLLHVAIVGDEGVGKSSIVRRYKGEEFDETARITIGIDETIRKLTIADQEYKISVADVPGQEKLGSATTLTFRGFQGVLLTFDLTNRESFESLGERLAEMDRLIKEGLPKERRISNWPLVILVGNKKDLAEQRAVSDEEIEAFVRNGVETSGGHTVYPFLPDSQEERQYFLTSAKTYENIEELFQYMAESILRYRTLFEQEKNATQQMLQREEGESLRLGDNKQQQQRRSNSSKCCN